MNTPAVRTLVARTSAISTNDFTDVFLLSEAMHMNERETLTKLPCGRMKIPGEESAREVYVPFIHPRMFNCIHLFILK